MKTPLLLLVLILLAGMISIVQAAQPVQEADLNQMGSSFEMNADSLGRLWISDFGAGEVWQVNPTSTGMEYSQYLIEYPQGPNEVISGNPSDARRDGDYFWWADALTNYIGRAAVSNGDYLLWQIQGAETFYGTAVDNLGRLWAAEWPFDFPIPENEEPNLIQLTVKADNTSAVICSFSLPDNGGTRYMAYRHPYLWLGDEINARLLRLNVDNNQYVYWQLPPERTTFGLTVDGDGDLWFADWDALVEFDPDLESISVYEIPITGAPQMIAVEAERVWYSGYNSIYPSVGVLNSTTAVPIPPVDLSQTRVEGTLIPSCDPNVTPHATDSLTMLTGSLPWAEVSYDQLVNDDGWLVLEMLEDSDPWGIVYLNEMIYVVDRGRQKLVKIWIHLPAITLEKSAEPLTYDSVGDVIGYSYKLTNRGNVTLTEPFTVTDDKAVNETCPATASLEPGQSITCTASYSVAQADLDAGSVTNSAQGHAYFGSTPVHSIQDAVTVTAVQNKGLTLEKTASQLTYDSVGDVIGYTFKLTNSGNVTLTSPFTVTDNLTSDESCPATPTSLAPGASITCTASYTISQVDVDAKFVTNTATGHGNFATTKVDSNQESETVNFALPSQFKVFLPLILR